MSIAIKVDWRGQKKLLRKFKRLDVSMRGTILDNAVKAGALIWRDEARRRAPRRRGSSKRAWRNIQTKRTSKAATRSESVEYGVSWRKGTASRTDSFYLLFAEKGTRHRVRKRVGGKFKGSRKRGTGSQSAKPFLIPAFDRKKGEAELAVKRELFAQIAKVARGG